MSRFEPPHTGDLTNACPQIDASTIKASDRGHVSGPLPRVAPPPTPPLHSVERDVAAARAKAKGLDAACATLQATLANIDAAHAEAARTVKASEARRAILAIQTAKGADVAAALAAAQAEHEAALRAIGDCELARGPVAAELELGTALAKSARGNVLNWEAVDLMVERIVEAERIDALLAELEAAYRHWTELGQDIAHAPAANVTASISRLEHLLSPRRFVGALPGMWASIFPNSPLLPPRRTPLSESERHEWATYLVARMHKE